MTDPPRRYPGIHAVLYALFDRDERLDRVAMKRQVDLCIAAGVDGVTVLGLATEVGKLSERERRMLIDWTAEDVADRAPLSVTVAGHSALEQIALAQAAEKAGAAWLILQPSLVAFGGIEETIAMYGRVADATSLPVALQNAPGYLGRGLSAAEIKAFIAAHPNCTHMKLEVPATGVRAVKDATGDALTLLNGRGGLEMIDALRAGAEGFVLAPDMVDHAVAIMRAWTQGDESGALARYEKALPSIVFVMQSLDTLITYGKRIFAARAGLDVFDRMPTVPPSAFGLELAKRHAAAMGQFPRGG